MEKLQAALKKARKEREAAAIGQTAQQAPQPRAPRPADGRTRRWEDLIEITPPDVTLRHHNVVTKDASDRAIPFDILRTKVLLQMQRNGWKSLAITSPMPQCGKTTTACNLALGLGRQSGLHTILFDMDLQDPAIHKFMGHVPQADITDVLSGQTDFAEQAVRVGTNVAVSMSSSPDIDPTRVLLAQKTHEVLKDIEKTYAPDITIFDMPSILVSDNARSFLKNVDCALIITRANQTRYGHFDVCEREVAEYTNVLGVVLNAFKTGSIEASIE